MSWNSYIDNLTGQGSITKGCIIGKNGATWTTAASNILNITPAEAMALGTAMSSNNPSSTLQGTGVNVEGIKYMFLRDLDDGNVVLAKKAGTGNLCLQATTTGVIIAFTPNEGQPGISNEHCKNIASYLCGSGY